MGLGGGEITAALHYARSARNRYWAFLRIAGGWEGWSEHAMVTTTQSRLPQATYIFLEHYIQF